MERKIHMVKYALPEMILAKIKPNRSNLSNKKGARKKNKTELIIEG